MPQDVSTDQLEAAVRLLRLHAECVSSPLLSGPLPRLTRLRHQCRTQQHVRDGRGMERPCPRGQPPRLAGGPCSRGRAELTPHRARHGAVGRGLVSRLDSFIQTHTHAPRARSDLHLVTLFASTSADLDVEAQDNILLLSEWAVQHILSKEDASSETLALIARLLEVASNDAVRPCPAPAGPSQGRGLTPTSRCSSPRSTTASSSSLRALSPLPPDLCVTSRPSSRRPSPGPAICRSPSTSPTRRPSSAPHSRSSRTSTRRTVPSSPLTRSGRRRTVGHSMTSTSPRKWSTSCPSCGPSRTDSTSRAWATRKRRCRSCRPR